ncbi:MAG: hypothetical protein ACR2HT_04985 [Pyrinomonadaceae bacterium]
MNETKNNPSNKVTAKYLVELDEAEFNNKQNEVADKAKARFEQAIKNTSISSVTNLRTEFSDNTKQVFAQIEVDASSVLLKDGNKYRLSEAKKYTRQIAVELFSKIGLKQVSPNQDFFSDYRNFDNGEVFIKLSIVINYNGAARKVAEGYINGNWVETIK